MKLNASLKKQLYSLTPRAASFIEPMECLAVPELHDSPNGSTKSSWTDIGLSGSGQIAASDCFLGATTLSTASIRSSSKPSLSFALDLH
jgi:hypothetical protein